MNNNVIYFKQAELAFAAYANLSTGEPDPIRLREDAGLSPIQAETFAVQYSVVDQHTDLTGLSATVFKDNNTGETFLTIRGTEINDPADLLTNLVNIALFGNTTLQPQYQSLKTKVQDWIDTGILPQNFTVTGHSLGGFLATDLTVDSTFANHITHTYLYNTPGQSGIFGDLINMMQNAWGIPTQYDPAKFSNIEAVVGDGFNISPVAGLGYDVSPPINVIVEDQLGGVANPAGALNHSIIVLTKALDEKQFFSSFFHSRKQSDKPFHKLAGQKLFLKIRDNLRNLLLGIFFVFFINQNAFCEKYNVNPAIDEDFITWSNSMPKEEAVAQLKDFLSAFNSWEEVETWLISKGFSVISAEMNEHVAKKHGIYPAFSASASWGPEQGIIFSNGWLQKMVSKILVHGWSVGIRYTENGQFTIHRVKVTETVL